MKKPPTKAKHFSLYPDIGKDLTCEDIVKSCGAEVVNVRQCRQHWELTFDEPQDWDELIDKFLYIGMVGIIQEGGK